MSKNTYIVKSSESTIGDEYYVVTVPNGTTKEEVMSKFTMAAKYASESFDDLENESEYDEHFNDMLELRKTACGQTAFNDYLKSFCGFEVTELNYDFEYEW